MRRKRIANREELKHEFSRWRKKVNNENRYYDDTPLLALLYDNSESFECDILQGESFYRGRIFDSDDIATTEKKLTEWANDEENVFQGYNKTESSAPPAKYATEGRLNGKGIPFLYTCSDINTVIYELRPTIQERVSVAEFVTKKRLVLADLTEKKANRISVPLLSDLLWLIAQEFSVPHYAGHNYSFTQYLAGHFMNMDFDGVIFRSSLNPNGENFVFFHPEDCEAINSNLREVTNIKVESEPITRKDLL